MQEHVTLLGPVRSPRERKSLCSTLPPGFGAGARTGSSAPLLLLTGFSFDPLVYFGLWPDTTMALLLQHLHTAPSALVADGAVLPAELDQLVLSCLARDPAERLQSIRESSY